MKRSIGVSISAVVVFIGSVLTLVLAMLTVFGSFMAAAQKGQPNVPFMKYFVLLFVLLMLGFAAWGIASGIGLLRLREWARVSMLIFSGILLLMCIPGLVMFLVLPFALPDSVTDPDLAKHVLLAMRIFMAVFYGILISIGVWWIYLFNKRTVKDQFRGLAGPAVPGAALTPRPVSITIIGWYLLVSACFFPMAFPLHLPILILGFMVRGRSASVMMLAMGGLQVVAGVGLLKLRSWARTLTICYFVFFLLNSISMVAIPGSQARLEEVMADAQRLFGAPPAPIGFPMWLGLLFSLPFCGILLWYLTTRKEAFHRPTETSAPLS